MTGPEIIINTIMGTMVTQDGSFNSFKSEFFKRIRPIP